MNERLLEEESKRLENIFKAEFREHGVCIRKMDVPNKEQYDLLYAVGKREHFPVHIYMDVKKQDRSIEEIDEYIRSLKVKFFLYFSPYMLPEVQEMIEFRLHYKVV